MKRKISIILLLIATLMFSLLAFTACGNDNDENGAKQVPVYQGMTITKSNSVLSLASYRMSGITLLSANNENNGDNGNHYGHYKGDHTDRNDTIDEGNPYPDNNANENIEEEIKSSLNVVGSPNEIYYAAPNEDIYINIHIDNPDSFEIMSFTLNGKKYSSYMFEEGSDMETIVLKYNVGDATGIVEYTIDAIKYIDGTEIKDVIIDGNKTVMAGIRTDNQVVASVTDVDIDTNVLSFNVNVKDNNSLVEFSKGTLKAVIYDGFNIISEKDIAVGNNSVIFDGLKTNTVYQYAVVGYYDDLSGGGFGMNVLYKDAFYTDSVVLFDNITVGQESISFGYLWHEDHQGKAISALKLYKGDAFIKDITAGATTVNELLSGTTYKLVAEYPNADKTESIYLEFATLAKATPEISVVSPTKTQTSIGFEISENDSDNVGAVTKIELVHTNGTVVADSLDQRTFANLLSNNAYTVKVTYVYNLNDGEGEHTITSELAITTLAKVAPDFTIANTAKSQETLSFSVSVKDTDLVGAITKVELIRGTEVVTLANTTAHELTKLLSNNEYTIKVTYTYDLNDGVGAQTIVKELTAKTDAKATPEISVNTPTSTQTSVGFAITETDTDNVGSVIKIELVHANGTTIASSLDQRTFDNLLSNNEYTVRVTYTYNLNDGEGEHTVTIDLVINTLAKATPEISVINPSQTQTSVGFEITETDTDSVGAVTKIELVHANGTTIASSLDQRTFANLLSNNEYTVRVTYTYNLNDGEGEHTVTIDLVINTLAKATPEISVINPSQTQTSVGFEITETDTDSVGAVTKIELVHANGTTIASSLDQRTFANLLSNNEYTIKVTYTYDLNDGEGEHTITRDLVINTLAKAAPSFVVKNENITLDSINAEYDITDIDNILVSYKVELYRGNTLVEENTEKKISFASLDYYSDYALKISYTYDFNDGKGVQASIFEKTYKTLPYIDVIECSIANTSAVSEGETIFMSVKLDNPLDMSIESVVINGETYNVTGASTKNKIFVEIVYNGQFAGGDTYLKIDKVNAKIDNMTLSAEPKSELSDNVFINGKLEVIKIEFVNEAFEPIDWAFPSEKVCVMITLDNSTGYKIDTLTESGSKSQGMVTDLKKLDNNHWYYELDFVLWAEGVPFYDTSYDVVGWFTRKLESLSYSNDYIEKTVTYSSITASFYRLRSDDIHYITSPDDLQNMNGQVYYELANDIDLSGLEWLGVEFDGMFDGKGYSIENMSFVGTIEFRCLSWII